MKHLKLILCLSSNVVMYQSLNSGCRTTQKPTIQGKYQAPQTAFICDYHDVITKSGGFLGRMEKAGPAAWQMSWSNLAKFVGRTGQYYVTKLVLSKLAPKSYPERCYEAFVFQTPLKDVDPNYLDNSLKMMNSDTIIPENIAFLQEQKSAGAYIAICTNNGPQSTKAVNDNNNQFLDNLCNNGDLDQKQALWTPNSSTDLVKKSNPTAGAYQSLLLRIAKNRPDPKTVVVIDDKTTNLAAAQAALQVLQAQEPPILPQAAILSVKIANPIDFVATLKAALCR